MRSTPGPSRCFTFWQEALGCYVVNAGEGESGKKKCLPALEDYYECLHHRKEVRLGPFDIFPRCPFFSLFSLQQIEG